MITSNTMTTETTVEDLSEWFQFILSAEVISWTNVFAEDVTTTDVKLLQEYLTISVYTQRILFRRKNGIATLPYDFFTSRGVPFMPCALCYQRAPDNYHSIWRIQDIGLDFHSLKVINIQPYLMRDFSLFQDSTLTQRFIRCILSLHLCSECQAKQPKKSFEPLVTKHFKQLEIMSYDVKRLFSLIQPFTRLKNVGEAGLLATQSVFFGSMDYTGWEQLHRMSDDRLRRETIHTSIFFNQWSIFPHWTTLVHLRQVKAGFSLLATVNANVARFLKDPSNAQLQQFLTVAPDNKSLTTHTSVDVLISSQPPLSSVESHFSSYEVDNLIAYEIKAGHPSFLVKWKGFSEDHATWHSVWDLIQDGLEGLISRYVHKWNLKHRRMPFASSSRSVQSIHSWEQRDGTTFWELTWEDDTPAARVWVDGQSIPFTERNADKIREFIEQNCPTQEHHTYTEILNYELRKGIPYFLATWQDNGGNRATWRTVWDLLDEGYSRLVHWFTNNVVSFPAPERKVERFYTTRSDSEGNLYLITWEDEPYCVRSVREESIPFNTHNATLIKLFKATLKAEIRRFHPHLISKLDAYDLKRNVPSFKVVWQSEKQDSWASVWDLLIDGLELQIWHFMEQWNTAHPRCSFSMVRKHILKIADRRISPQGEEYLVEFNENQGFQEWLTQDSIPFILHNARLLIDFNHQVPRPQQPPNPSLIVPDSNPHAPNNGNLYITSNVPQEFIHFCGLTKRKFMDKYGTFDVEKLAFTTLFPTDGCDTWYSINALPPIYPKRIFYNSFNTYIKARLLSHDKRFGNDHLYIFALLTTKLNKSIHKRLTYVLKATNEDLDLDEIRGELLNLKPGQLPHHRFISLVTRSIPPFPAYFVGHRWRLTNALAQRGPPHLFVTFSISEDVLLKRYPHINEEWLFFHHNKNPNRNQLLYDNWTYTTLLIVHFFQSLLHHMTTWLTGQGIQVTDVFHRFEFQKRGTPHIHILLWTPGLFTHLSPEETSARITTELHRVNKLICTKPSNDNQRKAQTHSHYSRCREKLKPFTMCKWNFPRLPIKEGILLLPIEPCTKKRHAARKLVYHWQRKITTWDISHLNWETWYAWIKVADYETYLTTIQAALNQPTYFPQRHFTDTMINPFIPEIQPLTESNMDIQMIITAEQAARYVTKYISKGEPGIRPPGDNLLRTNSFQGLMLKIQDLLSCRKLTVQEAVFTLLGLEPCRSTWKVLYHNHAESFSTSGPLVTPQRARHAATLLPRREKTQLYTNRPQHLSHLTLFEFFSRWNPLPSPHKIKIRSADTRTCTTLYYQSEPVVICAPFPSTLPPSGDDLTLSYYFLPWTTLQEVLPFDQLSATNQQLAIATAKRLRPFDQRWQTGTLAYDSDLTDNTTDSETHYHNNPELTEDLATYFAANGQDSQDSDVSQDTHPDALPQDRMASLLSQMTPSQLELVSVFMSWLKFRRDQCLLTCEGAGGTGKTFIIQFITEACREQEILEGRHSYGQRRNIRPMIAKLAPTGSAAFNMAGNTINQYFSIGLRSTVYSVSLDNIADALAYVDLILIDEMSMISAPMLESIDKRCQDFKSSILPFGGISVILFGDFLQLEPVKSKSWFRSPLFSRFTRLELRESVRQRRDPTLQDFLSNVRTATLPSTWLKHIKDNTIPPENLVNYDTVIFMKNKPRLQFNKQKMDTLGGRSCNITVPNPPSQKQRPRAFYDKQKPLTRRMAIKLNARVMIVRNQNTKKGITNGSIGHIIKVQSTSMNPLLPNAAHKIKYIIVKLLGGSKVKIQPLRDVFPLDHAWGITLWKAQGKTFNHPFVVNLANLETWTQLYVAISRATTLDHLKFVNTDVDLLANLKTTDRPPPLSLTPSRPLQLYFLQSFSPSQRALKLLHSQTNGTSPSILTIHNFHPDLLSAQPIMIAKQTLYITKHPETEVQNIQTTNGQYLTITGSHIDVHLYLTTHHDPHAPDGTMFLKIIRKPTLKLTYSQANFPNITLPLDENETLTVLVP